MDEEKNSRYHLDKIVASRKDVEGERMEASSGRGDAGCREETEKAIHHVKSADGI